MKVIIKIFPKFATLPYLLLLLIPVLVSSCTKSSENPQRMKQYYLENYPEKKVTQTRTAARKSLVRRTFWKDDASERPLDLSMAIRSSSPSENSHTALDQKQSPVMEETLSPPISQYAATEDVGGLSTSSMIETKIYNLVEDSYKRRDYNQFIKLYSLFVESFPHSGQIGFLDERRKSFFYRENVKNDKLKGALLEVSYPEARTFDELGLYFEKLRDKGIKSVQLRVVQFMGTPVFLFAVQQKGEGYYFSNSSDLTVDDILADITKMAHDNGLKVFASFPLRHHPRLGDSAVFMLDESWNIFQNRTSPNSKLDLLNPESRAYLIKLIHDLLKFKIDGIVLKDDFTYEINEGFSPVARNRYLTATGLPLAFNKMFVPVDVKNSNQYEILTSEEYHDVSVWRSREITQLLWDIIEYAKSQRKEFKVGIEITPEMLLDKFEPQKWYSTGLSYLQDLNVDFYVLKWRRFNSDLESDPDDYAMAVELLRAVVPSKKELFLKIPLSQMTKNTIEFNRKIDSHSKFQEEFPGIKIAVGPVDRVERLDIVN